MPEELLWRCVKVVTNDDRAMLEGTGRDLIQSYSAAWADAGCPEDARVFTSTKIDKATSNVWIYFFSPKAAEVARTVFQKPSLQVEACEEPDLSGLKEVKV